MVLAIKMAYLETSVMAPSPMSQQRLALPTVLAVLVW
jgi:hypothetical protein